MPLAFQSQSHGTVAFGFFNIATDLLLLEDRLFFADRFCEAVAGLLPSTAADVQGSLLPGWHVRDTRTQLGNLHGAIAGIELHGLIGATYRRWPFPEQQSDFKQDPDGWQRQDETVELITPFAARTTHQLVPGDPSGMVSVAGITFDAGEFVKLLEYVEGGGWPGWRDDRRPLYVQELWTRLRAAAPHLLSPWTEGS